MIRALHFITSLRPGGAELVVLELIKRGVGCAVCSIEPPGSSFARRFAEAGAEVRSLGVRSKFGFPAASRLRRLFRTGRYDLVQSHLFHANFLARLCRAGPPVVCGHQTVEKRFLPWRGWADGWTAPLSTFEVCASRAVFESLAGAGVPREKLRLVRNGVNVARFAQGERSEELRRSLGAREGELLLVCVARLARMKGHDVLLRALSLCRRRGRLRLVFVGDGPERGRLEALSRRLDVADGVTFAGYRRDVPAVLASSDMFVFASMMEGFGLSVAEAMAAGLPVVASAIEAIEELVSDGATGLLFPPGDARALADAIEILACDVERRRELGARGKGYALKELDSSRMAEGYARVHAEALG